MSQIPDYVRPALWSYDIEKLDLEKDKATIIFQVLNYGTERACKWLFSSYNLNTIKEYFENSLLTAWNKRSLKLWSVVLETLPKIDKRLFL